MLFTVLVAWLALLCSPMQTQPFLCNHRDMDQSTRCSVVECREFNEQWLTFTYMVCVRVLVCVCVRTLVCVCALRSLNICQAQHKGGAGKQECSSTYVCVSVYLLQ